MSLAIRGLSFTLEDLLLRIWLDGFPPLSDIISPSQEITLASFFEHLELP